MALGFRDCCNNFSYFYLSEVPTFVSESEVYFIVTDDGDTFCAEYVQIPSLNYAPPTYPLNEMTLFTSCQSCMDEYPCPTVDPINQIGDLATVTSNECACKTQYQLVVSCYNQTPTFDNTNDGRVGLSFIGGVPPYKAYQQVNGEYILINTYSNINTGVYIINNADEGTYYLKLVDGNGDEKFLECTLNAPPAQLTITSIGVNPDFYNASNGSVTFTIGGGTSPYFATYDGNTTELDNNSFTISNVSAGTYSIVVNDSATGLDAQTITGQRTLTNPAELSWPNYLCLSVNYCNNVLQLFFNKTTEYQNLRPVYSLSNASKSLIGIQPTDLFTIYFDISLTPNKWTTGSYFINSQTIQSIFNDECEFNYGSQFLVFENVTQTPLTSLPQIGTWSCPSESFLFNNLAQITTSTNSTCPITIQGSVTNACGSTNNGSVTINTLSGFPPYTYYKNGNTNENNPTFNSLASGSYNFYVIDSNGTQSNTLNLTVQSTNLTTIDYLNQCVLLNAPQGQIFNLITQNFDFNFNFNTNTVINGILGFSIIFERYIPVDSGISDPFNIVFLVTPYTYSINFPNTQDSQLFGQDDPYDTQIDGQAMGDGFALPPCDYGKYVTQYDLSTDSLQYNNMLTTGTISLQYGISGSYFDSNGICPIYIKITVQTNIQDITVISPTCTAPQTTALIVGQTSYLFIDSDNSFNGTGGEYQQLTNTYPCPDV
jgi:hypothetical protein